MILCNGCPKSGTHLLQKAIQLFGGKARYEAYHHHVPYSEKSTVHYDKHVHIIRSPKNMAVSWARFNNDGLVTRENLKNAIEFVVSEMWKFTEWIDDSDCLTTSFESLLTDPQEIIKIGSYIGYEPVNHHFERLWGGTYTFTGKPSLWDEYERFDFLSTWNHHGGNELDSKLGYTGAQQLLRIVDDKGYNSN